MKKYMKILFCAVFVISSSLLLSACSKTKVLVLEKLDENMVTLSYTETVYNGQEKTPTVIVKGENGVLTTKDYGVSYENNKNAGTAKVIVYAKEGSNCLKGMVEIPFVILRTGVQVSTILDLKAALDSNNYNNIEVAENISNSLILNIDKEECVTFKKSFTNETNGKLINEGEIYFNSYSGEGVLENEGNIHTNVSTKEQLESAFEFANQIKLMDSIQTPTSVDESSDKISLVATNRNYEFTIDLNGHNIEVPITFANNYRVTEPKSYVLHCYDFGIKASIINTSSDNTKTIVGAKDYSYGIFLSGNHLMSLNLENLQVYGHTYALVTNGCHYNFNADLIAKNCVFTSPKTNTPGMGAYLPAAYNYSFEDCKFEGATGYYTKNGVHVIKDCLITGTGEVMDRDPQGEGGAPTGAAMDIDWGAWTTFPFDMSIYNTTLASSNNIALQEYPNWNFEGEDSLGKRDITRHVEIKLYEGTKLYKNYGLELEETDEHIEVSSEFDLTQIEEDKKPWFSANDFVEFITED